MLALEHAIYDNTLFNLQGIGNWGFTTLRSCHFLNHDASDEDDVFQGGFSYLKHAPQLRKLSLGHDMVDIPLFSERLSPLNLTHITIEEPFSFEGWFQTVVHWPNLILGDFIIDTEGIWKDEIYNFDDYSKNFKYLSTLRLGTEKRKNPSLMEILSPFTMPSLTELFLYDYSAATSTNNPPLSPQLFPSFCHIRTFGIDFGWAYHVPYLIEILHECISVEDLHFKALDERHELLIKELTWAPSIPARPHILPNLPSLRVNLNCRAFNLDAILAMVKSRLRLVRVGESAMPWPEGCVSLQGLRLSSSDDSLRTQLEETALHASDLGQGLLVEIVNAKSADNTKCGSIPLLFNGWRSP